MSLLTQDEIEALWGEHNTEPYADDVPLPEAEPEYKLADMRQQLDVIIQAYKPLLRRVADLEAQVARLSVPVEPATSTKPLDIVLWTSGTICVLSIAAGLLMML